ncbi:putative mitochondrial DNA polymerase sigma-like protein [Leptomonas pyrrhocoris]|uniref:Putative mitochondrial DNA polymerase sigma-like protein n=1 Tax=Leptomonas pyrrhocoris TaxID=157538 RepID=A0A0N0E0S5_LEPPY|nr:putative mitochondrial DNA polymerase sigma-like protein [Leptomonas pyrrhocoris]XP_015665207.1 putative mitochondrial DNA polymerase sigma-like protein [Leptomonas pyrrhocoris]KPA86767.1 putative mitochondrial DNA polymerase sigma-like protein [Leptomonas pyrrhocoris]KPA86768.1 putative mitochondrial DNA polymerase sigma-like protein [Leptomonas pyrrhocoris]|eukprot:XP_015665206.1 putative mitochondrial DNA polymerase sigma-like protein [Leptomonas pyrrhocoris]
MTQTSSVEGTSTYPSRRRISSQSKDHRQHRHVNLSESSRHAHGSHRASSSPAPHKDHSKHNHDNNNHHSTSERHRRRDRDEEDSDSSGNRAHQRVSRRTRTEDTNAKGFPSTVVASASSSPSSTFLSTTDTVQGWLPATSVATCILPLDAKLVELLYALSPTADDRDGKLRVIDEVRRTLWRTGLDIQIYGSLCTGLVIPASDVDCVMMRSSDAQIAAAMSASLNNALLNVASAATSSLPQRAVRAALTTGIRTAADRMRRHSSFTSVTCIAHAKVPIVKCRHRAENVKVDLSFEKDGCVSSNYLCELFCEPGNELARPLIVLIKAMVNHYGLDDPSVGGLGSFPVSMLVLWYLKHRVPAHYAPELHHSIAVLLVGFLQYYGKEFDFKRQGIDYVQQKTFAKAPANDLFIVNPIRPGTNCARAATLFATRVVPQFQKAAEALSPLLDPKASQDVMEQRLLQFFAKSLPGVRSWRDVARQAARSSHRPQNMWDQATNLYLGGVL